MNIRDWPEQERPREKMLNHGAAALSDAELLAIFLRTGMRGTTAVDLARQLLHRFGNLRKLLQADQQALLESPGLGPAKLCQIGAVLELARRHLKSTMDRSCVISSPAATRQYLHAALRDYSHEVFACLFLDNRHRVIAFEELFHGTIDGAAVHPRVVAERALYHRAAALIAAHNHPSGNAEPSMADKAITQTLKQSLELLDIHLLDHFVIGDEQSISMAEQGFV